MLDWTRTKKSKYRQWKWSLISVIEVGFGGEHLAQRTGPFSYPSLATRLQKGVDKDGGPTLKQRAALLESEANRPGCIAYSFLVYCVVLHHTLIADERLGYLSRLYLRSKVEFSGQRVKKLI